VLLDRQEWKCLLRNSTKDASGSIMTPMGKLIDKMPG